MVGYSIECKRVTTIKYMQKDLFCPCTTVSFFMSRRAYSIRRHERKPWRPRSPRSIGICEVNRRLSRLYHGILSRGIADKDSSQFTVMPSPAGKTREGNPVPRFSSRHIPNLDGDRLPFQCPALGYHAPRACT